MTNSPGMTMACYRGLAASVHRATADFSEPLVGTEVQVGDGGTVEEILDDRGKGPHALSSFAFPPRSERPQADDWGRRVRGRPSGSRAG